MRSPPRPQDNDSDDDDGDDNDNHRRAVETNSEESDGADKNRDYPTFAFETIRQFNTNVIAYHLKKGYR